MKLKKNLDFFENCNIIRETMDSQMQAPVDSVSTNQPKRLKQPDYERLIARHRAGDRKAFEEIWKGAKGMFDFHSLAQSSNCPVYIDKDDFEVLAQKGLLEAVRRYEPGNGTKFTTLAYRYMKNKTFDVFYKGWQQKRQADTVSITNLEEVLSVGFGYSSTSSDLTDVLYGEYVAMIERRLEGRLKKMFLLRLQRYTIDQVAEKLKLSDWTVSNLNLELKKKVREVILLRQTYKKILLSAK